MARLNKKIFARKKLVELLKDISEGLVPTGTTYEWVINDHFHTTKHIRYTRALGLIYKKHSTDTCYSGKVLNDYGIQILNSHVTLKYAGAFEVGDTVVVNKLLIDHLPSVELGHSFLITGYSNDNHIIHCGQNSFDPRELLLLSPKMASRTEEAEEDFLR